MSDTTTAKAETPGGSGYRAYVLFILIVVYTFNFIDRQIIGILSIPIQAELGLSDTQLGLMRGVSFAIFYSTLGVPIAMLADRTSRKWVIGIALTVWSAMTAVCGLAMNFWQLFFARMMVGVGEAGGVAPAYSLVSDYFPPEKRGRALAIYSFGIPIGSAVGIIFGGVVATLLDWRAAFIIVGLMGVVLAPIFLWTMKEPKRGGQDAPGVDVSPAPIGRVLTTLFTKPSFFFLALGAASSSMMGYGLFAWIPAFLVRSYDDQLPGFLSWMPDALIPDGAGPILYAAYFYGVVVLVGGLIGIWLGGALADKFGASSRAAYARVPAIAFLCVLPFFALGMLTDSLTLTFFIFIIPTALSLAWLGPVLSALQHIVPPNMRATASALFLLINNLVGIGIGDFVLGAMSDGLAAQFGEESLRYSILTGTAFYLFAAIMLFIASGYLKRDWVEAETPASAAPSVAAATESPEATLDAGFTEQHFTTADGLKIHYRDYPPTAAESGVPVLCLHGLTRNLKDFEDLAPRLAAEGRRVISATQRGRGGSDWDPQHERYNPAVYTQDMLALLDHLGIEKAVFIGTSMGGLMTMVASTMAPQRIERAVLNDIGPELDPAGIARIRSYAGKTEGRFESWQAAADAIRAINGMAFPKETDNAFWLDFANKTCREAEDGAIVLDYDPAIAKSVAEGGDTDVDLWPLFDGLKAIPTLVVRGGISDLLMVSTIEEMKRRKPDLQTVEVPDVGHAPFLTEAKAWTAIRTFLR